MVREAIRGLEAIGVVEVRGRSGAYVQSATAGRVGDALMLLIDRVPHGVTVRNLLETRRMLEVEIAGVAATRRTKAELRDIGRALADSGSNEIGRSVGRRRRRVPRRHRPGDPQPALYHHLQLAPHRPPRPADAHRDGAARDPGPGASATTSGSSTVFAPATAPARRAMRDHLAEAEQTLSRLAIEIDGALRPPSREQAS